MILDALPRPEVTVVNRPYWQALAEGRLVIQVCCSCGHLWLPPRERCPDCLGAETAWQTVAGRGRVISWVVYHKAYHEALADRVPYDVTLVELEEGPRLLTNVIDSDAGKRLFLDARVRLSIETREGLALPLFRLDVQEPVA